MTGDFLTNLDPVARMLISGEAGTMDQAEELYLDRSISEVLSLVESDLSDAEFRAHPLIQMLFARGSRAWEDSLG
jgi:hypothetical protein